MSCKKIALWMAFMLSALAGRGQSEELVTDRPDQSNAPRLLPIGALQIELGSSVEKYRYRNFKQVSYTFNNTVIKFGVNENIEAQLSASYVGLDTLGEQTATSKGFMPISVGAKLKLAEQSGAWPQTALIAHITSRSGSVYFKPMHTSADMTLAFSNDISQRISLTYNVGMRWTGDAAAPVWCYTASAAFALSRVVGFFIEAYGSMPEAGAADHRCDGGITIKLQPLLQVDVSAGSNLSINPKVYFLSAGLSYRMFK